MEVVKDYEFWGVLDTKTPEHITIQWFGRDRGIFDPIRGEYGSGHKRKTWVIGAKEIITVEEFITMARYNEFQVFSKNAIFDFIIKSLKYAGDKPFLRMEELATSEKLKEIFKKELIEYSNELNLDDWMGATGPEKSADVINRNLERISGSLEKRSSEL